MYPVVYWYTTCVSSGVFLRCVVGLLYDLYTTKYTTCIPELCTLIILLNFSFEIYYFIYAFVSPCVLLLYTYHFFKHMVHMDYTILHNYKKTQYSQQLLEIP